MASHGNTSCGSTAYRSEFFTRVLGITVLLLVSANCVFADKDDAASDPASDNSKPVILIPPFDGGTNRYHESSQAAVARGVLEDGLVNKKVKVVERERVDAMLQEAEFSSKSGLSDEAKAVKMGKLLGANTLVMGSILGVTSDTVHYNGNGIRTQKTTYKGSIRVRVIDIAKGTVVFSRMFVASETFTDSTNGGTSSSDASAEVLHKAVVAATNNTEFIAALAQSKGAEGADIPMIEVDFSPTPEKCDILIDGDYRGSSPLKLRFPVGKTIKVTVRKAGFVAWEASLIPSNDVRRVDPELAAAK